MLSCFFSSSPPTPPLFQNSLLADPSIRFNQTSWDANYYDMLATASLIVFVVISIFAISYSAFFIPAYVYHVVTASAFVFPIYFSIVYAPYKASSIEKSQEFALESLTKRYIEEITGRCTRTDKDLYLRSLHHQIGAEPLSLELQTYMTRVSGRTNPYETLIPIYARALAYNDLAKKILKEISDVFMTPAKPIENRKIQELNYQELLVLNSDPSISADQKKLGDQLRANKLSNRFNLENSYLEYRMKSIRMASIASNPIHPGISIGSHRSHMDVVAFDNEKRYERSPSTGAFIRFDSSNTGIERDSTLNLHTLSASNIFYASLSHMLQSGQIRIDFTDPSGQNIDFPSGFRKEIEMFNQNSGIPILTDMEWNELNMATRHFLQSHFPSTSNNCYQISQIHFLLNWQGNRKELLCYPIIAKLVHTDTAHRLGTALAENDPNRLENRILSFLFSALPLRFPTEFSSNAIPIGLLTQGASYQELLKNALLPPCTSFSDQELLYVRNFLNGIRCAPAESLSIADRARQDKGLAELTSQIAKRLYLTRP